jgi:hypothetical protein
VSSSYVRAPSSWTFFLVLGLVLVVVVHLRTLSEKVSGLAVLEAVLEFPLEFTWFSCILSNLRVNNTSSSSPCTSNSLSGKDIKGDKEYMG